MAGSSWFDVIWFDLFGNFHYKENDKNFHVKKKVNKYNSFQLSFKKKVSIKGEFKSEFRDDENVSIVVLKVTFRLKYVI